MSKVMDVPTRNYFFKLITSSLIVSKWHIAACGVHQEGAFQCQQWHLQDFHPHTVCSQPRKNTCKASRLCTPAGLHRSRVKTSRISIDLHSEEDTMKFFLIYEFMKLIYIYIIFINSYIIFNQT